MMSIVTLPLMVLGIGGSSSAVGAVLLAGMVPRIFFSMLGGTMADWRTPKSVMIASDVLSAAAQATLGVVYMLGLARLWIVIILTLVLGSSTAMFMPASSSILPRLVEKEKLHTANSRLTIALNIGGIIGGGVAGVLISALGIGWVFLIDALTFLVSAGSVTAVRPRLSVPDRADSPDEKAPGFVSLLRDGLRASVRYPWFWRSLSLHLCLNLAVGAWFVCAPIAAVRYLGGSIAWSALATASTVGGLLGGIVAARLQVSRPLRTGLLVFGVTGVQLVALGLRAPLPLLVVIVGLCVAGSAFGSVLWATALQHAFPGDLLARVNAVDFSVSMAGATLGYLAAGPMTNLLGLAQTLVALGVILLAMTALVWLALGRSADKFRMVPVPEVTHGA
jgi:predicted MFS family arabinose efflux permease